MGEIHRLIKEKLNGYPKDVRMLATRALEFSESMPEAAVVEQLKGVARNIIKDREASK